MQNELSNQETRMLDHLELKESITATKLSEKMKLGIPEVQKILESLAIKQYAINYGTSKSFARSMWCCL